MTDPTRDEFVWSYQERRVDVVYESRGEGAPLLLLPAFSTVSTRAEMQPLAEKLSARFRTLALDWPGFGDSTHAPLRYDPDLYHAFLADFREAVLPAPCLLAAGGHAAG